MPAVIPRPSQRFYTGQGLELGISFVFYATGVLKISASGSLGKNLKSKFQ